MKLLTPRAMKVLGAVALVLVIAAAGLFYLFGGAPPPEVDLSATAAAVSDSNDSTDTTLSSAPPEVANGVNGVWTVDTTIGTFVIGNPTSSFVGFRVDEELTTFGSVTAVGRTPEVSGTLEIDGNVLASAEIVADLTGIVSDKSRRENAIQGALNTSTNPTATFTLTEPVELTSAAADGELIEFVAVGQLTINGLSKPVEIPLQAQLVDGAILITGSIEIVFADFGVTAPTAPVVVSVEDHGILELQIWASRP
jgi:polyisoprenoid-binding protein YceI